MPNQCYSVVQHPIDTLLAWVKSSEIAIPEIQRPFVWDATKVRNLLDSLYQGYPIGYLIVWRNPDIRLKDGTLSQGRKILIDGQQRVTALMASLLGRPVLNKGYETVKIRIAFHPQEEGFEVLNPLISKDPAWIPDLAEVFSPEAKILEIVNDYCAKNPGLSQNFVFERINRLSKIIHNHVGIIELSHDLDIETVTEIFIRVNSAGMELSQADFAMSKIAVNETYGGNILRKAIDYFCHLAVNPEFYSTIEARDPDFAASEFYPRMNWLKDVNDDIYDPSYTDMLRVAFTSEFGRGKLQDLVSLISGRNFETHQYEEEIAERSFQKLNDGINAFINRSNFERFVMILRSAGFKFSRLIGGQNAVNFAYIVYLKGREEHLHPDLIERLVRRWYAMSILRGRYSGSPETRFDQDIRQIIALGLENYANTIIESELPDSFWTGMLPQTMDTSSIQSPYWRSFQAAQVKDNDKGFLSREITVHDLLQLTGDVHHVYPRNFLKQRGFSRGQYNQIANYAITQSEINIAIGDKPPVEYFAQLHAQCQDEERKFGGINDLDMLRKNLLQHCVPFEITNGIEMDYEDFLSERRKLMALKIRDWFENL